MSYIRRLFRSIFKPKAHAPIMIDDFIHYDFLHSWYSWATGGYLALGAPPYGHVGGLCAGIGTYLEYIGIQNPDDAPSVRLLHLKKLMDMFCQSGLSWVTPFDANIRTFAKDFHKHANPKRLSWVKARIDEYALLHKAPAVAAIRSDDLPVLSPLLREFLISWYIWAVSGSDVGVKYTKTDGLCYAVKIYVEKFKLSSYIERALKEQLVELFDAHCLSRFAPFNECLFDFMAEKDKTRNPARIKFVRDVLIADARRDHTGVYEDDMKHILHK